MGTAQADDTKPWHGHFNETRLLGDWWFVNRYSTAWWVGAILATLFVPPVGAACLGYMVVNSVYGRDEDVDAKLA